MDDAESDWIRRSQEGDRKAFGFLVQKYMQQAYYTALGFLGTHEDALDASQEAFVRAYRSIGRFAPGKKFFTWYYQILKNHCMNMLRTRRIAPSSLEAFMELHEPESSDDSAEELLHKSMMHKALWEALWTMEAEDRQIIVARDLLNTSYATLAEVMECPLGTVMSRLYYARRRLREKMKGMV
jgi:RNA polymerase sigma-70 factor, ECF subfamily